MSRSRSPGRSLPAVALLVALMALPLAGGPATAPVRAAGPAPLTAAQLSHRMTREVYGYLPYWELDSSTDAYLRYDLLTTIALFSFRYGTDGTIQSTVASSRFTGSLGSTIIGHAHAAGVRVELAFSFSSSTSVNDAFFADATAQKTAIARTVTLVTQLGADGVDLDVERLSATSRPGYAAFGAALRKALRAKNPIAQVSVATNGASSGARMASAALAAGVDRAFLMGYSYRSTGTSPTGSNSPIVRTDGGWSLTASLDAYKAEGAPLDRVILGLPYFGLTRPTVDATLHSALNRSLPSGTTPCSWDPGYPYHLVKDAASIPSGTTIGYDTAEQSAWFATYDSTAKTWCETYFDTPRSLTAKYDLALSRGLAGVGLWALGFDAGRTAYWSTIAASFSVLRLAGRDRYATAAAISAATFQPGVPVAYVATGTAFPDAVAAGPAAAKQGGPVLLVTPTAVPSSTAAELKRLRPARIVLIGSNRAVSDAVAAALKGYATSGTVDRIGGRDRYATAAAVSASTFAPGVSVAYVATGANFPDALAGAAAAKQGGPVLLVTATSVPPATATELARLKPAKIIVLGSSGVVSDAVAASLGAFAPTVTRAAGTDRFGTAAAASATAFAPGVPVAYIATGFDFPDALAGAAAAASQGGPVLLAGGTTVPPATVDELQRLKPRRIVVLGSSKVVPDALLPTLRDILAAG